MRGEGNPASQQAWHHVDFMVGAEPKARGHGDPGMSVGVPAPPHGVVRGGDEVYCVSSAAAEIWSWSQV